MTIADVYQMISTMITNKVGKIIKSEHGAVETAIVDTLDSLKYNKTGGEIDGVVDVVTERVGKCFRVKDKATGFILLDIDEYGHVNSYGTPNTAPYASGGFNVWRNGNLRLQMVTEDGDFKLNMYNDSNQLVCKLDTNGLTKLLGIDVQNYKIENLADPVNDSDAINLGKVKALISELVDSAPETLDTLNELANALGDDPNFATTVSTAIGQKMSKSSNLSDVTNRQTAVNNLFDATNLAVGQTLVKDKNGDMVAGNIGSTGANLRNTYFISDTEESDTWKAGKTNFKTIGGFLVVFDNNTGILHSHSFEGNIISGSDTITAIADTSLFNLGDIVYHANIPYNSIVVSKTTNTLKLSRNATGTASGATIELKNHIDVIISGGQTTTAKINRVNITYKGSGTIVHNSNIEYLLEHTIEDLKQPIDYLDSNLTIISVGTKGLFRSSVTEANQRSALTGFLDYKFKIKSYRGLSDIIHFGIQNDGSTYGWWYNNNISVEYDDIDVVGHWLFSYGGYGFGSKHIYRGNRIKATKHVIFDECGGGDYDIHSELETTNPINYYAFACNTYQGIGHCILNIRTKGKLKYMGGGVINIRADSVDTPEAYFVTAANYYKELIINGTIESPSLIIAGQVQLNARINSVHCRNGCGITKIKGTHGKIYVDEDCSYPLILEVGTNYNNSGLSITSNREVITRGWLFNLGYEASVNVSAGVLRNQGTITDGYYGVQVSGTGKFINEPCGRIIYGLIGINESGGNVVQNGKMEHQNYGGAEICAITKSAGNLTVGSSGVFIVGNSKSPIRCTANTSASKDVKYHHGASSNCDGVTYGLLIAYDGSSYAPNDLLGGSVQENTLIID